MDHERGTEAGPPAHNPANAEGQPAGAEANRQPDANGRAILVHSSTSEQDSTLPPAAEQDSTPPPPPQRTGARSLAFQVGVLLCYLAAGVLVSWPRASFITGRVPEDLDQSSYVWDFWWIAHQVTHLGNPWFTRQLAAPVGVQLGFDTLMPLPGLLMTPVTLLFGPAVSYNLVAIVMPGLACFTAYRAARLFLSTTTGAIAAGAFYGLAAALVWQDWYHLNVGLGAVFFPMALEASVRLRRSPGRRQAVILGLVLGGSFLVNQESAIMCLLVAAPCLLEWLARSRSATALRRTALAAGVTVLVASPQLIAMAQQALSGGATLPGRLLANQDTKYGVPLESLFAPSPRVGYFGLTSVAHLFYYQAPQDGLPTFGAILSILAVLGLVVAWQRPAIRWLGLGWLACAAIALGSVLRIGKATYIPVPVNWHTIPVSAVMPYTWLVHLPGLSGLREPDRFIVLGLLPAALLAGIAVEWLLRRAPAVLAVALALAVLEAGYSGWSQIKVVPVALPALDAPIAADHSHSVVVDVPFGLRGGLGFDGREVAARALMLATADGHPRGVSDTSWVPAPTVVAIERHPFYAGLLAAERIHFLEPFSAARLRAARRDALRMGVRWAILWKPSGQAETYLRQVGFDFREQVDHVKLFRLTPGKL
jgi:hypothetical protein